MLLASSALLGAVCVNVSVSQGPDLCDDFTAAQLDELETMDAINAYPAVQQLVVDLNATCCANAAMAGRERAGCDDGEE